MALVLSEVWHKERSNNRLPSWLFMFDNNYYTDQICCTDMCGSQRMYPSYLVDSVTFYLVTPSMGTNIHGSQRIDFFPFKISG